MVRSSRSGSEFSSPSIFSNVYNSPRMLPEPNSPRMLADPPPLDRIGSAISLISSASGTMSPNSLSHFSSHDLSSIIALAAQCSMEMTRRSSKSSQRYFSTGAGSFEGFEAGAQRPRSKSENHVTTQRPKRSGPRSKSFHTARMEPGPCLNCKGKGHMNDSWFGNHTQCKRCDGTGESHADQMAVDEAHRIMKEIEEESRGGITET